MVRNCVPRHVRRLTSVSVCLFALIATISQAKHPVANPHLKQVLDVRLHGQGTLIGQLVSPAGKGQANVPVRLLKGSKLIVQAKTDARGRFAFRGLRGGSYRLAARHRAIPLRVWPQKTAPPKVAVGALLVDGPIVRAQNAAPLPPPIPSEPIVATGGTAGGVGGMAAAGPGASGGLFGFGLAGGGGLLGMSPLAVGAGVAAAVAIPVAIDDNDDAS